MDILTGEESNRKTHEAFCAAQGQMGLCSRNFRKEEVKKKQCSEGGSKQRQEQQ